MLLFFLSSHHETGWEGIGIEMSMLKGVFNFSLQILVILLFKSNPKHLI